MAALGLSWQLYLCLLCAVGCAGARPRRRTLPRASALEELRVGPEYQKSLGKGVLLLDLWQRLYGAIDWEGPAATVDGRLKAFL